MNGYSLKELQNAIDKQKARSEITNVNQISKEMIADMYIEWVKADREYQRAREDLYRTEYAHIDTQYDVDYEQEFRTPNKPYRTREDKVEALHRALTYHNKVYDALLEMTDLYLAKIRG